MILWEFEGTNGILSKRILQRNGYTFFFQAYIGRSDALGTQKPKNRGENVNDAPEPEFDKIQLIGTQGR